VLGFSVKIYSKALDLAATLDPGVIFIILIIILNLHDLSLSEYDFNIEPKSIGCESCYNIMS